MPLCCRHDGGGVNGHYRRRELVRRVREAEGPVNGSELAQALGVSRQVIVQDVAVLRAAGEEIISTPRGYMLLPAQSEAHRATLVTRHGRHDAVDELSIMVDHGLRVLDVVVEHPLYGELRAPLMFGSRSDVQGWHAEIEAAGAALLSDLTEGVHIHTVEAADPGRIERARDELRTQGFLVE